MPINEPTPEYGDIVDPAWMEEVEDSIRALEANDISVDVARATTQSIPNNTITYISWTVENEDLLGFINAPGDTITIPANYGGVYTGGVFARFAANATNLRVMTLEVNGSGVSEWRGPAIIVAAQPTSMGIAMPAMRLAAGDTVKVSVFQGSGGALNIDNALPPRIGLIRIAA